MTSTATVIVLTAGTITFANEWYQTQTVNWKIPLATILAGLLFDGLAHINDHAAVGLSVVVLIGAVTTKFGGKSVADSIAETFTKQPSSTPTTKAGKP